MREIGPVMRVIDPWHGLALVMCPENRSELKASKTLVLGLEKRRLCPKALKFSPEEDMEPIPLEVWIAFEVIAAGGVVLLAGYLIKMWTERRRK